MLSLFPFRFLASIVVVCAFISVASANTWVCEAEKAGGFASERGYQLLDFTAGRRYIIRADISPDDLSFDFQRDHNVFSSSSDNYSPASIQEVGNNVVALCTMIKSSSTIVSGVSIGPFASIACEGIGVYGDLFNLNLNTGRFTQLYNGFESDSGGQSWVEVGECRRTM